MAEGTETRMSEANIALDVLHHASEHVRRLYRPTMKRQQAQSNLDARAILFDCSNAILREHGIGISREEIEGAAILEREANR
jgi:hypothetical protein